MYLKKSQALQRSNRAVAKSASDYLLPFTFEASNPDTDARFRRAAAPCAPGTQRRNRRGQLR